jgi:hypothetical protein
LKQKVGVSAAGGGEGCDIMREGCWRGLGGDLSSFLVVFEGGEVGVEAVEGVQNHASLNRS